MGQTGLALMYPVLIHAIAITDQNPGPAFDQGLKGRFTAAALHFEQGHGGIDHHPQPS
jgi:hypothetical protein